MKITIVYDNTAFIKGLRSDWGFSALIEGEDIPIILFDTGGSGRILLDNMKRMDIDPKSVDEVFISHAHLDHTGGLSTFLSKKNDVKIWVPPSVRGIRNARKVVKVRNPTKLHKGVYSTGELEGVEQSLCIKTDKGILVIAGCSHPSMSNILNTASQFGEIYGIIGGLHGTDPEELSDLDLICATHCTQHKAEIKRLYSERFKEGGVGRVIEL